MRDVEIPGGTAKFLETSGENRDEIPGRAVKLIKASSLAAMTQLADYPELFEPLRTVEDESGEKRPETADERQARLAPVLKGLRLTTEQAMAFDNMREATVVATLHSWTLDRRLPTLETIGDLDGELYGALLEAVGGVSAAELEETFEDKTGKPPNETRGEVATDPTGRSGSSSESSPETPQLAQTPTSGDGTSRSDGEASSPEQ